MNLKRGSLIWFMLFLFPALAFAKPLTIAAASDLRYAMDALVQEYSKRQPDTHLQVTYGSSGKFSTQIRHGAPFAIFFSADEVYPLKLHQDGLSATAPKRYALGRLVVWTTGSQAVTIEQLSSPAYKKIAIANPEHAPYGVRAQQALHKLGLWNTLSPRIVKGENVSQAAQMVYSGAADAGIIALALVFNTDMRMRGSYRLVDDALHEPLWQSFIITKHAANDARAKKFTQFVQSADGHKILARYGFTLPEGN